MRNPSKVFSKFKIISMSSISLVLRSRPKVGVLRLSKDEGLPQARPRQWPSFVLREPQDAVLRTAPQDEVRGVLFEKS
jgi:hypothetical protein